jgi:hypothetical protein
VLCARRQLSQASAIVLNIRDTSCAEMPSETYILEQVFMYDTHEKSKEKVPTWISGCYNPKEKKILKQV